MFLAKPSSGSSAGNSGLSYASTSRTSLLTGLSSLDQLLVNTVTGPHLTLIIGMGCHYFSHEPSVSRRLDFFNFSNTASPTWKFLRGRIHLFLAFNCCRYSLLHLDQNSCARCCVCLHLFLQYNSSLLNSSGGGSTSLVFPVSSISGDNRGAERGSLRVSTVTVLLLIVLRLTKEHPQWFFVQAIAVFTD